MQEKQLVGFLFLSNERRERYCWWKIKFKFMHRGVRTLQQRRRRSPNTLCVFLICREGNAIRVVI